MVFSSSEFIFLFLPIVLAIYFLLDCFVPVLKNGFLCIASLMFYAFGEPKFVLILLASIVINWVFALGIDRIEGNKRVIIRKVLLFIDLILNIGLLVVFKYTNFITLNLSRFISSINVTSIALPIGISFFTFQAMSYVIDVYRGEKAQVNPINLALYISLFPQLIAGPIVRYNSIANEIRDRTTSKEDFTEGICCFLRGLFKKIVFANNFGIVADAAFANAPGNCSVLFAWLGALAYTLQIYFDFSGYSDMAIGLGRMFGFHFSNNFDYPYAATSITDFWRRWHISLSSWFRDYVYIPLGGSRGGSLQLRNLFIVWLLTGIWHGANWTFIAWGMIYFVLLVIEKSLIKPERFNSESLKIAYRLLVFIAVMLLWVLFRSDSIRTAVQYVKSMFGMYGNLVIDNNWLWYSREYVVFIILGLLLSTHGIRGFLQIIKNNVWSGFYETIRTGLYTFMFLVCVSYLVIGSHNPFIYFNF